MKRACGTLRREKCASLHASESECFILRLGAMLHGGRAAVSLNESPPPFFGNRKAVFGICPEKNRSVVRGGVLSASLQSLYDFPKCMSLLEKGGFLWYNF